MQHNTGKHCIFYHHYHVIWLAKYQFQVLQSDIQEKG